MGDFSSLGLSDWLIKQCKQLGINKPTAVQENCMPAILEGRDCMGCAKTGSGKTAAFVLPVLQKLSEDPYGIFCLVLTPTRELAYQIAEQFRVLGKPLGLRDCIIVGGMDMVSQALELSNQPHVVVATPGRLADHIRSSNTFSMSKIQFLILDEADRLLEQGCTDFTKDLEVIMGILPAKRQTLLFSATLTDTLQELKKIAMNKPFFWESKSETRTVEELDQRYILTPEKVKDAYLVHLIQTFTDEHDDWSIIIFTNTCKNCQILTMMLREFNFPTISLHSMMKQKQRFANLAKFKASVYKILIATDVASRGLDIPTVQVVINHNTPGLPKIYIHRVGRTARAGRNGVSITLVTQYDIHLVHSIEEQTQTKLKEYPVQEKQVLKILTQVNVTRRECEIKLESTDFDEKKEINKRKQLILEGKDPDLEAKRRAELEKIRSQKKKFKQKIQESIQRQKDAQLKKKLMKRKQRKKQKAVQATA
ncbi:probable ATP-dependent RNA helicase DDX49 [Seriola lalandi dorsalis]|uniref:Probable ATP-dependent RNA helicase DDX49 n=1 Tax=Seriola lalandi dorsalis TaxID=1841481 RepID=A0A3B4X053_SERLL|nr:probable ATP-dependent RNA helicase DDX49 [Seriola lalandi dorsalis]XP_056234156.1 probable ATP-dependent RNA helicase DDX49 [Seriola aureovittata]